MSSKPEPKVWNLHDHRAPRTGARYIGRGSPFGNPFRIGDLWMGIPMTRDVVCDRFEVEVLPYLDVSELRGFHLLCYCKPERCHGDLILKKANK